MVSVSHGRIADLCGLPELVRSLAGEEGLSRAFREQEIPESLLAMPETVIPMKDIIGLYHRAAMICGVRSFGLMSSEGAAADEISVLGVYLSQAPTLGAALERFRVALPYHESGSRADIEVSGDEVRVLYRNDCQDIVGWQHGGDFTLCAMIALVRCYLGDHWRPLRIETPYPHGAWETDHEDAFQVPVHAETDGAAIILERRTLAAPRLKPITEDETILTLADLMRAPQLPKTLPQIVSNLVEQRLAIATSDLDSTAARLGLGVRTLQRRLLEDGISYRGIVLRCRMRRARELLAEREPQVQQVARQVGYASAPQFIRAFQDFHGCTPLAYRDRALQRRALT